MADDYRDPHLAFADRHAAIILDMEALASDMAAAYRASPASLPGAADAVICQRGAIAIYRNALASMQRDIDECRRLYVEKCP